MISINEVQDEVIAEFNDFDDWMDRYQLLIDLGNEQEPLDEKYKTEQNLIEGCQSRVWLQADEARYGILLDMVGGKNATFYKEQFSQRTAGKYVNKIWNTAHRLGFGNFFPKEKGTEVTDDHMYVYNLRQIPCVDIINYDPNCDTGFGDFWHTIDDTMDIIDKGTLNAVGQTLLEVIYNEK